MAHHSGRRTDGIPCWLDISVSDVDAAVRFYGGVLGWEFSRTGGEYGGYRMASVDGVQAAGISPMQGRGQSFWIIYFATSNVDSTAAEVERLGGEILVEPFDVVSQGRTSLVTDPTGARFGLWQAFEHHGFGASGQPGFYSWAEVNTSDAKVARDFYAELFGASHTETPGAGTTYYSLTKDGKELGGILQMDEEWEGVRPHWMAYFEVANIARAVAQAKERGGVVAVEPFDSPFGRVAVLSDMALAPFSLLQRTVR